MIKNINEYQELAVRTMSKERNAQEELITFALGVAGEACEVAELLLSPDSSKEKYTKELGDVLWYVSGLTSIMQEQLKSVFFCLKWREHLVLTLCSDAGKIADYVKKVQGHGHDMDPSKMFHLLTSAALSVAMVASDIDIKMEEIATENIDKLKKRYPDGFSQERSKNREA
jgi:NTP pyrophosphatase (non-canonical NTP hydrolase)